MASAVGYLNRLYNIFYPSAALKSDGALRFGILGAANIGPMALITPAKSHPDVLIAAVAARDHKKAEAYAKKHGIPIVHKTYDDLITDPSLDCIYVPLPNGLHYEWTLKALKAGKHVLLEKPSVSNAVEAKSLFRHPILREPDAPVLLEAFHYQFHPGWQYFKTLFDPKDVEYAEVKNSFLAGGFPLDDIRFNYSLSGGTLMDFGAYAVSSVRAVFAAEPTNIISASYRPMPDGFDKNCDEAIFATYAFPNGGTAKISADLQSRGGYWLPALTSNWPNLKDSLPTLTVRLKPKEEGAENAPAKTVKKEIIFHNYMAPHLYHRIDIITTTEHGAPVPRKQKVVEHKKVYKWATSEATKKGEEWWGTYRYQLEAFVDRVKKREGTGVWVDGEDSIRQMETIDATYDKVGLPVRPTSEVLDAASSTK